MRFAAALLAIVLAGCATPPAPPPPAPAQAPASAAPQGAARAHAGDLDRLVVGLAAAARLPVDAQRAELAEASRAFARDGSDYNRAWLGGLHAVARPPLRNDARAAEILEPLAATGRAPAAVPLASFAAVLSEQLAARQRTARDGVRRQELLRQQLEALRDVERTNLEREKRVQDRTRSESEVTSR